MSKQHVWNLAYRVLALCSLLALNACTSTVRPKLAAPRVVESNGDFLGFDAQGNGVISATEAERYNDLILLYGKTFIPPLTHGYGLSAGTNDTYIISPGALNDLKQMTLYFNQSRPAVK